jgi:hypothetical protein
VGFKKDYVIVNSMTGAVTELFPTGKAGPPIAAVLPNEQILLELDSKSASASSASFLLVGTHNTHCVSHFLISD